MSMLTLLSIISLIVLAVILATIYVSVWMWIKNKQAEKRVELCLWMTVHRVAFRHGIDLPEGMSLDEAGTYVEQQIEKRGASKISGGLIGWYPRRCSSVERRMGSHMGGGACLPRAITPIASQTGISGRN